MDNVVIFADPDTVAQEAREWLIKLDGDEKLIARELAALREWADRSPAHQGELVRISAFWDDVNILTELAIPLHNKTQSRKDSESGFFSRLLRPLLPIKLMGGITALCLLGLSFILTNGLSFSTHTSTNGIYATAIGEIHEQTLADGSVVRINTNSQIHVDYSSAVRKIRLLRGEAHFEVSHDSGWPFEVYAGTGMVKAVGTAFSVQLKKETVKVIVTDGRVDLAALSQSNKPQGESSGPPALKKIGSLDKSQSATFTNRGFTHSKPVDVSGNKVNIELGQTLVQNLNTLDEKELSKQLSWRDGFLVFAGDPLSYVIEEVNRYTPTTIEITDPALSKIRIGGRFKVGELDAMFDVLETSFGIQVNRVDEQHIQLLPVQQ
jgi:transmembrane sensor